MKRLCFGTYASVLRSCIPKKNTKLLTPQKKFVGIVLMSVNSTYDITADDYTTSRLVTCDNSLSGDVTEKAQTADIKAVADYFKKKVLPLFDPNKTKLAVLAIRDIILNDGIDDDTVIDLVSGITKLALLSQSEFVLAEFLAGVFLYTARAVDNTVGKDCVRDINDDYITGFEVDKHKIKLVDLLSAKIHLPSNMRTEKHPKPKSLLDLDESSMQFCFSISFAEPNIELDVTSESGVGKVFNTNYTDCIADEFSTETKNQILKWFVSGKNDAFIVILNDKRIDYAKSLYADVEAKIDAGQELNMEEQLRYSNLGLLIRRFESERRAKEKAVTVYLKDKLFHAYSHADFYTYLLDFIKDILDFPYRRGILQDVEYRKAFSLFDVYTLTVPKEYRGHFVVDLLKSDVEEAYKNDNLLQFNGNFVCDWGVVIAKKIAVQYYVQYIGRQIIDHDRLILESDEYLNAPNTSIHYWRIGPH